MTSLLLQEYCTNCVHFWEYHDGSKRFTTPIKCEAFKKGIPVEILSGEHLHNREFPGDNGLRFERMGEGATP